MEPNYNTAPPSGELPQLPDLTKPHSGEQGAPAPETKGVQQDPSPVSQQAATSDPIVNLAAAQAATQGPTSAQPPASLAGAMIADDADLIEKEWVTRAKAIILHTKDDPHVQNDEMNKVKADYLKKRYNKDLKVNEK